MQNAHIGPLPPSAHLLAPSGCGMLCSHLFRTLACPAEPANPRKAGPNAPSGVSLVAKPSQVSAGKMLWESRRWGELGGRCGDAKVGEGLLERSGDPHGGQLARDDIRLRALCAHSERSGTLGRLALVSSEQDVLFAHAHCCLNGTSEVAGVSSSHISMEGRATILNEPGLSICCRTAPSRPCNSWVSVEWTSVVYMYIRDCKVHAEDPAIYRSGYPVAWCLTEVQRLVKLRCSRSRPPLLAPSPWSSPPAACTVRLSVWRPFPRPQSCCACPHVFINLASLRRSDGPLLLASSSRVQGDGSTSSPIPHPTATETPYPASSTRWVSSTKRSPALMRWPPLRRRLPSSRRSNGPEIPASASSISMPSSCVLRRRPLVTMGELAPRGDGGARVAVR